MKRLIRSAVFLVLSIQFSFFLPHLLPQASLPAPVATQPTQKLRKTLSYQAIERHFESTQPVARPQLGGALPGRQLIQAHRQRETYLQQRKQMVGLAAGSNLSTGSVLPGLETRPSLGAGSFPTAIVTGDFNNDGHLDYAIANGNDSTIWIYLGNGDGTFQLPRVAPLTKGLNPVNMVAADLRHRGVLDLVVAEFGTSTIGVLAGNGDGTFGYEQVYELPDSPGALTVNDFNHDGRPDIAAVMITTVDPSTLGVPYIAMLAGKGDGTFSNPVITSNWGYYSDVYDVDSADVNGDGLPDLLITGPDLDNSTIYLNNGDGTFKEGQIVLRNGFDDAVVGGRLVDVNGDGCPDAVIADLNTDVWTSLGNCAGSFAAPTWVDMGQANTAVRLADVNGDGHLDLVASSAVVEEINYEYTAGNTVSVALGDGKGNFGLARLYQGNSEAMSVAVGDFKGDGRPSIVTPDVDTDTATIYPNDGQGGFGSPQGIYACLTSKGTYECPYIGIAFGDGYTFADLNGDGKPDIFELGPNGLYDYSSLVFLNDGSGHFGPSLRSDFNSSLQLSQLGDYKLGDFRKTGHLDLVAIGMGSAYSTSQEVLVFQPGNGDGTFGNATVTPVSGANGLMATGDFNGDGKLDFVTVNGAESHILTTFLGNGDGTFRVGASQTFSDTNGDISRVLAGDFNRDGKLDILVYATGNGNWTAGPVVWEFDGNGDGTFQQGRQLFTGFEPMTLADINNDGHADIVRYDFMWPDGTTETQGPARFTNYIGQADGTFKQVSSYTPYSGTPESLAPYEQMGDPLAVSVTGDYNGDGKIDEVAFQFIQPGHYFYAQMLMGNGDGTFTPTYDVFTLAPYVDPMSGHDLNGDGLMDMVSLDWGSGGMMIQLGTPAPALQMVLENSLVTGSEGCGVVFPDLILNSSRTVTLSSSMAGVLLQSAVTIPPNAASAEFCFTLASNYDWRQVFDINASLGGSTATAYGSEAYSFGFSESVSPSTTAVVYAGQSTLPVTVMVNAGQGYSGGTISFSCDGLPSGYSCQFTPSSASLAVGTPASTSLVVTTAAGYYSNTPQITIVANDGSRIQRQALTLNVATLAIQNAGTVYAEDSMTATMNMSVLGIPPYTLSCAGLPASATCSFTGTQAAYPANSAITVNIAVGAGVATGTYPFQLMATSGGQSTTAAATLDIFAFNLQAPTGTSDWTVPNSNPTVTFPVQASGNLPGGSLQIGCTLDSAQVCQTLTMGFGAGTSSVFVTPQIPASIAAGQHQLNVTTTFFGVTQNYSFPYYIADFSGTLSNSSVAMKAGTSTTLTATLIASAGFSDLVTLTCGGSTQITCIVPSSTQLTSAAPQTISITLTASSTAAMLHRQTFPKKLMSGSGPLLWAAPFPILIGLALKRRRWRSFVALGVCCCALCFVSSCGSGGGTGTGGGGGGGGSNTYTETVSAAASGTSDMHTLGSIVVTVSE
jgi:hypothetical protein